MDMPSLSSNSFSGPRTDAPGGRPLPTSSPNLLAAGPPTFSILSSSASRLFSSIGSGPLKPPTIGGNLLAAGPPIITVGGLTNSCSGGLQIISPSPHEIASGLLSISGGNTQAVGSGGQTIISSSGKKKGFGCQLLAPITGWGFGRSLVSFFTCFLTSFFFSCSLFISSLTFFLMFFFFFFFFLSISSSTSSSSLSCPRNWTMDMPSLSSNSFSGPRTDAPGGRPLPTSSPNLLAAGPPTFSVLSSSASRLSSSIGSGPLKPPTIGGNLLAAGPPIITVGGLTNSCSGGLQ